MATSPKPCRYIYAASRRYRSFDWNAFLRRKTHTTASLRRASLLASEWVTCACGNQCRVIPRCGDGEPIDQRLSDLGMTFYRWIDEMSVSTGSDRTAAQRKARTTLGRIERRARVLIRQMEKAQS